MRADWVDLNNNADFWKLEWFNESPVPKIFLSRNVPWIQERLLKVCTEDLNRALLGGETELALGQPTVENLERLIWVHERE